MSIFDDIGGTLQKIVVAPFLPVIAPLGFLNGGKTLSDVSGGLLSPSQAKDAAIADVGAFAIASGVAVGTAGVGGTISPTLVGSPEALNAEYTAATPLSTIVEGGVSNPATAFATPAATSAPAGSGFFGTLGNIGSTFSKFIVGAATLSNSVKQVAQTWLGGSSAAQRGAPAAGSNAGRIPAQLVGSGGGGSGFLGGGGGSGAAAGALGNSRILIIAAAALALLGFIIYRRRFKL